jgi:hypothetical protein
MGWVNIIKANLGDTVCKRRGWLELVHVHQCSHKVVRCNVSGIFNSPIYEARVIASQGAKNCPSLRILLPESLFTYI